MTQTSDVATEDRPRLVDVVFALILTASACVLAFTAMLPFQIAATVAREKEAAAAKGLATGSLEASLQQFVLAEIIVAVAFTAVLVWSAFRIRAGRRPFRPLLIVLTVLALLPANGQALLVVVLLVVADVLVYRKPVSEWMRSTEAARALAKARRRA